MMNHIILSCPLTKLADDSLLQRHSAGDHAVTISQRRGGESTRKIMMNGPEVVGGSTSASG